MYAPENRQIVRERRVGDGEGGRHDLSRGLLDGLVVGIEVAVRDVGADRVMQ
jgi:hypothetical protein